MLKKEEEKGDLFPNQKGVEALHYHQLILSLQIPDRHWTQASKPQNQRTASSRTRRPPKHTKRIRF